MSNVTRLPPFSESVHVEADIPISQRDEFERELRRCRKNAEAYPLNPGKSRPFPRDLIRRERWWDWDDRLSPL